MSYQLGVDLGTTHIKAAVARPDGRTEPAPWGAGTGIGSVPAVVHVGADGALLVGPAAQRRTLSDPDRVVHELVRRIGDDTPLLVGTTPIPAASLAAQLVAHVVGAVNTALGAVPAGLAVTHPATWGPHRVGAWSTALRAVGLDPVLVPEPHAAAAHLAPAAGAVVAVLDIGGTTTDATVLRREPNGFVVLGRPERLDRLGGADLDELVFEHVRAGLGDAWDALDPADPATLAAVAALRSSCTAAKERLGTDPSTRVPVDLPGLRTEVPLARTRFEELARPVLDEAVRLLEQVLEPVTAAATPTVLLVGGSARIPLVAELVGSVTGLEVVVGEQPATASAAGAAAMARVDAAPPVTEVIDLGDRPTERVVIGELPVRRPTGGSASGGDRPGTGAETATGSTRRPMPAVLEQPTAIGSGAAAAALPPSAPPPPPGAAAFPPPAPPPPPPPPGGDGVRPVRPASKRSRIPLPLTVAAALVAAVVVVGGLFSAYRAGTIAPTDTPAAAAAPLAPAPGAAPAEPAEPPDTAAPEIAAPETVAAPPAEQAPPVRPDRADRPANRQAPPPARPTTTAPPTTTAAPATTAEPPAPDPEDDPPDDPPATPVPGAAPPARAGNPPPAAPAPDAPDDPSTSR